MLITLGHHNCWEYGVGFFLKAVKAAKKLQLEMIRTQAIGVAAVFDGGKIFEQLDKMEKHGRND